VTLASSTDIEQHQFAMNAEGEEQEEEEEAKPPVLRYSMEFLMKFQHVRFLLLLPSPSFSLLLPPPFYLLTPLIVRKTGGLALLPPRNQKRRNFSFSLLLPSPSFSLLLLPPF
jgi:hypothetical protein